MFSRTLVVFSLSVFGRRNLTDGGVYHEIIEGSHVGFCDATKNQEG